MVDPATRRRSRKGPDTSRARIVEAARSLLGEGSPGGALTVEALARRARVSRMTVYYQFQSSAGVLEVLYDELTRESLAARLNEAMAVVEPRDRLDAIVRCFALFWSAERTVLRRMHALSVLDPILVE